MAGRTSSTAGSRVDQRLLGAAIVGFASGAFFDGILLHQILQWHHLLSLVEGGRYSDLRVQILADGLFHGAAYLLAISGIMLLWRKGQDGPADRDGFAWAILGFAVWQFTDVALVHWLLGLHRVRVGVPNPLLWDLGWLGAFGLLPLIAGIRLLQASNISRQRTSWPWRMAITVAVMSAGLFFAFPGGQAATAIVFENGIGAPDAFAAVASIDGRVIWSAPNGEVVVADLGPRRANLYVKGALLVISTSWIGCFTRLQL
jgi:uncharacterized membrane protein